MSFPDEKITKYMINVLIIVFLGFLFDSLDVMIISFALPLIISDLQITLKTGSLLVSFTLMGMVAGSMVAGTAADYIGRVKTLYLTIMSYAAFSGLCALAHDFVILSILRIFTGFGCGGALVICTSLWSEIATARYRSTGMGIMISGWPIGSIIAAVSFWVVTPIWGWRPLFLIGVLPAVLCLYIRMYLREPERWLVAREKRKKLKAAGIKDKSTRTTLRQIYSRDLIRSSSLVIILGGTMLIGYYGLISWFPTFLVNERGLTLPEAGKWLIVLNTCGFAGYIFIGLILDRLGRKLSFTIFYLITIIMGLILGFTDYGSLELLIVLCILSFVLMGAFTGFFTYMAEIFPSRARSTGMGVNYGIARMISILSPYIVANFVIAYGWSLGLAIITFLYIFALAYLLIFGYETKGKSLDELK